MPINLKSTRRNFVGGLAALGGALLNPRKLFASSASAPSRAAAEKISGFGETGNVYEELGVSTVISIALAVFGYVYFKRSEFSFADLI